MAEEIWSELNHEFKIDAKGGLKKDINIDSVISSICNILGTRPGERVMLPTFAARINDMLFEPINDDMINFISDEIKRVVEKWDPRVSVSGIDFYSDPDRSYIEVTVRFKVVGYSRVFEASTRL